MVFVIIIIIKNSVIIVDFKDLFSSWDIVKRNYLIFPVAIYMW